MLVYYACACVCVDLRLSTNRGTPIPRYPWTKRDGNGQAIGRCCSFCKVAASPFLSLRHSLPMKLLPSTVRDIMSHPCVSELHVSPPRVALIKSWFTDRYPQFKSKEELLDAARTNPDVRQDMCEMVPQIRRNSIILMRAHTNN